MSATAIIIGAGHRGFGYAQYALETDKLKIIGVADPSEFARNRAQNAFNIATEHVFNSWEHLLDVNKFADFVIIATQDQMHKDPAIAMAKKGYHILLEKPMATTLEDCEVIVETVKAHGVMLGVCHVLRYYPIYKLVRSLVASGAIGDVTHVQHTEPVGFWHFAHSFVRGNWRNEKTSSCSLLAKCCHDLDLITYWLGNPKCTKISSFGSLMHFTEANKPKGAADRCLDCSVHEECPYSAQKIYLDRASAGNFQWPVSVLINDGDIEDLTLALRDGPYGRCVYNCDNDVISNQVVSMQFQNGATATVTMVAFTEKVCERQTTISGTKGEITCGFSGPVRLFTFADKKVQLCSPDESVVPSRLSGHGGSDYHVIKEFTDAIINADPTAILTGPDDSLYSHRLVFEAERSRLENCVVLM